MKVIDIKPSAPLTIAGPTEMGFFIHDVKNNLWGGKQWHAFGCPKYFRKFKDAHIEAASLQPST